MRVEKGYILVLNMGMKSIRSIIYNFSGERISTASRPIETYLDGERVTQDPFEWWDKAKAVIKKSIADIGNQNIRYLTVTASSSCLVCVDETTKPLGKCMMVSDKRAGKEAELIAKSPAFSYIREKMGVSVNSYFMIPKILWVKNNQNDVYLQSYKFLSPDDFLIAKMTGKYVTDVFNAQKYYYDIKDGGYPIELLKELNIDERLLPEVQDLGFIVGRITDTASQELGLKASTEVILTSYDAICGFFGSGVSKEGEASDASGTVTALRALSYKNDLVQTKKIFNLSYKQWGLNIVGGSNNLGGGLIEWVKQCYYQNEAYPYEIMEKDAQDSQIGAGGLIFLPYLMGERAPIWNNDARGVFFGLDRSHTRKEMTRAVFESAGFIDLDMINAIEETGMKVNAVRLSGGLARVNLISQIKADITGREMMVVADFETTACGAAIIALVGAGVYGNIKDAADNFISVRMIIKPIKSNHEKYMKLYRLYKEVYADLKDLFVNRMNVVKEIYPKHEIKIANM